jgi:hypothetical protein
MLSDLSNSLLVFVTWTIVPTEGSFNGVFLIVNWNNGDKVVGVKFHTVVPP